MSDWVQSAVGKVLRHDGRSAISQQGASLTLSLNADADLSERVWLGNVECDSVNANGGQFLTWAIHCGDALATELVPVRWARIADGVDQAPVTSMPSTINARWTRFAPGACLPPFELACSEDIVVLQGEFSIGDGLLPIKQPLPCAVGDVHTPHSDTGALLFVVSIRESSDG